jgi:hypothetical protein
MSKRYVGFLITCKVVSINGGVFARSKIIFKIINGIDSKKYEHTKKKGGLRFNSKDNRFIAAFRFGDGRKKEMSFYKKEDAGNWLNEMRLKFEQGRLPHNLKRIPKSGFYGVIFRNGKYYSDIRFKTERYHLGTFDTAKEASNAFQLAKQQLKDGIFVPLSKINKSGFIGVVKKGNKFIAQCNGKYLGIFDTAEEAHAAYLKAKNHKTFDDGLDILAKLAKEFG